MTNNRNVLENFGGVDANSLCRLLNNNDDNGHPDDEPNIVQMSSYYDDDSLNKVLMRNLINLILKFNRATVMNSAQFAYRKHGCPVTLIPLFFKSMDIT